MTDNKGKTTVMGAVTSCNKESDVLQESSQQSTSTTLKAKELWDKALPISGTPAERYLVAQRGIDQNLLNQPFVSEALRYDPTCYHDSQTGSLPCLLVKISTRRGGLAGIQRIFLDANGKKLPKDQSPKKTLGTLKENAVYIGAVQDKVIITEGVEDALTLAQCCPEYAVLAILGNNTSLQLPEIVEEVIIAADNDDSGQKFARKIRKNLQEHGKAVGICTPPGPSPIF